MISNTYLVVEVVVVAVSIVNIYENVHRFNNRLKK